MSTTTSHRTSGADAPSSAPESGVAAAGKGWSARAGGNRADEVGRSARKHRAIIEAATALFLRDGYQGTSMDEIAALAAVSKQTVYKHFADKERLFAEVTLGAAGTAEAFIEAVPLMLRDTDDLEHDLRALGRRYIAAVMQPRVLRLRRLVIAEAGRFPELARTYYERVPERVIAALASSLQRLAERGLLHLDDPLLAANHCAFLILATPLDKAMFCGDESFTAAELERFAGAGVRVFLAAYGRP